MWSHSRGYRHAGTARVAVECEPRAWFILQTDRGVFMRMSLTKVLAALVLAVIVLLVCRAVRSVRAWRGRAGGLRFRTSRVVRASGPLKPGLFQGGRVLTRCALSYVFARFRESAIVGRRLTPY